MSQQPPNSPQPPFGNQPYGGQPQQPYYPPQQQPYQGQPQQPYYPPQQQSYQGQPMQPGMYPSQQPMLPPQQPPKKKRNPVLIGCGGALALLVVIIVIVVIATSATSSKANSGTAVNNGSTSTTGNTRATSAPATQSTFKVGQAVSVGNTWQITILSAKTNAGSQYNTPQKAGDVFLDVQIAVKNISGQSQNMSSALQWTLQDSTGQKYDLTIDTDAGSTLDGAVAAGMTLKGAIAYEVPKSIHTYTMAFQNDITSSDQTIWNISV